MRPSAMPGLSASIAGRGTHQIIRLPRENAVEVSVLFVDLVAYYVRVKQSMSSGPTMVRQSGAQSRAPEYFS